MKHRIEFTATLDVYDDDEELDSISAAGWVHAALLYGDKHSGEFTSFLGEVTDYYSVEDEE
ncbi:hypothetical protein SEA_IBANTIK_47 [Streptomyces phage Ibantik]|uniref:Uncharacterized protein n=1 Tax=Streptomyces phage Ibantik TaxID=2182397 RepID=A0A2U8UP79_9CAUD|nr:hypothetical protein QEH36_gp047 [Streptomyces phage Ibantik]AWN05271.1 hypothetical protein SEA_IBANTIK_47 [Streptomyces phage Ibantik]